MASVILAPAFGQKLLDETHLAAHPIYGRRPLLRGRIHQASALVSIPVGFHVVFDLAAPANRTAAAAYAGTGGDVDAVRAGLDRVAGGGVVEALRRAAVDGGVVVAVPGAAQPAVLDRALAQWSALEGACVVDAAIAALVVADGETTGAHRHRGHPALVELAWFGQFQ